MDCSNSNSKNSRRYVMTNQELTYWVTLALMPRIWTRRKNEIYVKCFEHNPQISVIDLFEDRLCWDELFLTDEEKELFSAAYEQLPNNSFMVEDMLSQGYEILPIHCDEYPKILKKNLGKAAPTVIFTKGNKELLNESSIAIVGSRNADKISLQFTDNVAKRISASNGVVVSGFAKGVDRQALDSALAAGGKSIIVLPQGIMTFASGFKQYYKHIIQGHVLVMSSFAPKAPWSKEFAMARNPIIYGMASHIYVAQSDDKGGTWSGVLDGLRKNRAIYVRWPEPGEKNANVQLVRKGAMAVDINGGIIKPDAENLKTEKQKEIESLNNKILKILSLVESCSSKDILIQLGIDWSDTKMKKYLEAMPQIKKNKIKNRVYFSLKSRQSNTLSLNFE